MEMNRRMESQVVRDSLCCWQVSLTNAWVDLHARCKQDVAASISDTHVTRKAAFLRCLTTQTFCSAIVIKSIVPQQALALSNSRLAIEMSDRIAERLAHSLESPETGDFMINFQSDPYVNLRNRKKVSGVL